VAARRIEEEIARISQLRGAGAAASLPHLRKALGDRVNLVVAKAAEIAGELRIGELTPDLLRAFDRLFEGLPKSDPQCWGKNAIARALKEMDYSVSEPFLRGAIHVQMEPVWGGSQDTAGPLRGACLQALPGCQDIRREQVMRHLVEALAEADSAVRADAARALATMGGDESALLLRLKARVGDKEASVTGQVLESLLILERVGGLPFVKGFLNPMGGEAAEEAALALGSSRMSGAVDVLLEAWESAMGEEYREALLRALSISRDERAIAFVQKLASEGRDRDRKSAQAALELFGESENKAIRPQMNADER
jgi:HEAT repeat protein